MKRFANPDRAVIEGIGPYFIVDELPMTWTDGEISKHIERVLDSIVSHPGHRSRLRAAASPNP